MALCQKVSVGMSHYSENTVHALMEAFQLADFTEEQLLRLSDYPALGDIRLIPDGVGEITPRKSEGVNALLPVVRIPPTGVPLAEIERLAIVEALKMARWVQKDAAELLDISPRMMNYKINTLHIEFPAEFPRNQWKRRRPVQV